MNVVLYARVSSEKQAEKDLSLPAQLKALREYALKRNWTIVEEYVDEAESARTADRPAFQKMIAATKQKKIPFETILVWKLNRFARNREDSIIYKSLLRKRGVQVISINENFDDGPSGRLLEGIIETIDEFYSANLAQDTTRGMKENTLRGYLNGGKIPYGYSAESIDVNGHKKKKLTINEAEASVVRKVFALSNQGKGSKEITNILNDEGVKRRSGEFWSISNIIYILQNETYTGCLIWHEARHNKNAATPIIRVPDTHPAIISRPHFDRVRSLVGLRNRCVTPPRAVSSSHLLSMLLKCRHCGHSMLACSAKSGRFHYYTCQSYKKIGKRFCRQKLLNAKKVEPFVMALIKERVLTRENIKKLILYVNQDMKIFEKDFEGKMTLLTLRLEEKLNRRKKLYNTLETGNMDIKDIAPRIKELNAEIEALEEEKRLLQTKRSEEQTILVSDEELNPYVDDLQETLFKGSISEKKGFLRSFIKEISIDYPTLEIEYILPLAPDPNGGARLITREVLRIDQNGSPNGSRTRVPTVRG